MLIVDRYRYRPILKAAILVLYQKWKSCIRTPLSDSMKKAAAGGPANPSSLSLQPWEIPDEVDHFHSSVQLLGKQAIKLIMVCLVCHDFPVSQHAEYWSPGPPKWNWGIINVITYTCVYPALKNGCCVKGLSQFQECEGVSDTVWLPDKHFYRHILWSRAVRYSSSSL